MGTRNILHVRYNMLSINRFQYFKSYGCLYQRMHMRAKMTTASGNRKKEHLLGHSKTKSKEQRTLRESEFSMAFLGNKPEGVPADVDDMVRNQVAPIREVIEYVFKRCFLFVENLFFWGKGYFIIKQSILASSLQKPSKRLDSVILFSSIKVYSGAYRRPTSNSVRVVDSYDGVQCGSIVAVNLSGNSKQLQAPPPPLSASTKYHRHPFYCAVAEGWLQVKMATLAWLVIQQDSKGKCHPF